MNSEKYYTLARDCVRQAEHAATQDEHDKLIEQATVYLMAALAERKQDSSLRAPCRDEGKPLTISSAGRLNPARQRVRKRNMAQR